MSATTTEATPLDSSLVTTDEEVSFGVERSASEVAARYGVHYYGDDSPVNGGFFYASEETWVQYGFVSVIEFWIDPETKRINLQEATLNRPAGIDITGEIEADIASIVLDGHGMEYDGGAFASIDPNCEERIWQEAIPRIRDLS